MPTHFTNGVSDVIPGNPLYELGRLDPTKYHIIWDDFITEPFATEWTLTVIEAGAGNTLLSTPDEEGGLVRVTTAANENDGIWVQTIGETFLMAAGKQTWIKSRIQVGDAIQSDWVIGLHTTSTTPQSATMRFLFESVDGSAVVTFNNDNNTDDTDSAALVTMTDDTFVTLAAYYDGVDNIRLYVNDASVDVMTGITVPAGAAAEMAAGFGYINGAAGAETTDVDYILVVKER